MGRRRKPQSEKKTTWAISIDPKLKAAAFMVSKERYSANASAWVVDLIVAELRRLDRLPPRD